MAASKTLKVRHLKMMLRFEIGRRQRAEKRLSQALTALKETRQSLAEFKALETATGEGDLDRNEFLVTINRQMRSPLGALTNSLELLTHSVLSPDQLELANGASLAATSLLYQLNQLRDLGHIELHGLELEETDASVADMVDSVIDLFTAQTGSARVTLWGRVSPEAAMRVHCDASRLRQILINLLTHAMTFRPGDRVTLDANRTAERFEFEVRADQGGTSETRKQDAGPERSEPQRIPDDPGGLGLAIAHRVVELMGGEISSHHDAQGLRFIVRLPLQGAREPDDRYIESLKRALPSLEVAVVEGVSEVDDLVRETLERWAIRHTRIHNAHELDSAGTRPNLIIAGGDDRSVRDVIARLKIRAVRIVRQRAPQSELGDQTGALEVVPLPDSERQLLEMLAQPELRHFERPGAPDLPVSTRRANILIAEDSMTNRLVTRRMLEKLGHRVHGVADGREAIAAAQNIDFGLILMDLRMPIVDGIEATEGIVEELGDAHPPIVAVTGDDDADRREECLKAGMSDYLVKPVDARKLADTVDRWAPQGRVRRLKKNASRHEALPLLDSRAMARMTKQVDASLIPEIGQMFLDELEGKIKDARRLASSDRHKLIPKMLDPLKGTAASFGAHQLAEVIDQVVSAAASEDRRMTEQRLGTIEKVAADTAELLVRRFREMEGS